MLGYHVCHIVILSDVDSNIETNGREIKIEHLHISVDLIIEPPDQYGELAML